MPPSTVADMGSKIPVPKPLFFKESRNDGYKFMGLFVSAFIGFELR
jgi:hypothetical protein